MSSSENDHKKGKLSKKLFIILGIILVLILLGIGIYFYGEYQKNQNLLKNPTLAAQVEAQTLISELEKLMVLPKDEQPTIATVSDVNKLKEQPFFAKAQNGYKVIIYPKSQKAILYDPKEHKIVEVGPINLGETTSPTPAAPITVALYNGTKTTGLTSVIEKELQEKKVNVIVTTKENASKSDYTKTIVVDITASNAAGAGKHKAFAIELAKLLGGEVGLIPSGEAAPKDAEILVILGK